MSGKATGEFSAGGPFGDHRVALHPSRGGPACDYALGVQ